MLISNYSQISASDLNKVLMVAGFVHTIRDHGGLIFIDLRSGGQLLQCVVDPNKTPEIFALAEKIRPEFVLKVEGKLIKRSPETVNKNLLTGEFELSVSAIEVVSKAKTLPFDVHSERQNLAGEELRLKYRYLDLRRDRLQHLLKRKSDLILSIRNWFAGQGFLDVQTPILANSTPEGARDFLVPSRLHPGKFYALPQAPQQFKQLLMIGGVDKYMQIAPCFRDEDPRSDRHPGDFYQVDGEVAWADEEQIFELSKNLIEEVFAGFSDKQLATPTMTKISYFDAMNQYGSDKPDLRYGLAWTDVKSIFKGTEFKAFADLAEDKDAKIQALVIKGVVDKLSRSDLDKIQDLGRAHGLPGIAYIQYFEAEAKSPIFKFLNESKVAEIQVVLGAETGDLVLFLANKDRNLVWKAQDSIRKHLAKKLDLIDDNVLQFVWIDGFPMFEQDPETGSWDFTHNPFSLWQGGKEALDEAVKLGDLSKLVARQYDVAANGYEVLSGGVRNTNSELQLEAFKAVGYTEQQVKSKFGHMLEAYEYGSPTHAGFAWGLDRLFMILEGEENIREVIAFPKNGRAMDTMTNSPSEVNPNQLKELGIKILE